MAPGPHPHNGLVIRAPKGGAVGSRQCPAGCLSWCGSAVTLGRGVTPEAATPAQPSALWFSQCLPSDHDTRWELSYPGHRTLRLREAEGRPTVTQLYRQPGAPGPRCPNPHPAPPKRGGRGWGGGDRQGPDPSRFSPAEVPCSFQRPSWVNKKASLRPLGERGRAERVKGPHVTYRPPRIEVKPQLFLPMDA